MSRRFTKSNENNENQTEENDLLILAEYKMKTIPTHARNDTIPSKIESTTDHNT